MPLPYPIYIQSNCFENFKISFQFIRKGQMTFVWFRTLKDLSKKGRTFFTVYNTSKLPFLHNTVLIDLMHFYPLQLSISFWLLSLHLISFNRRIWISELSSINMIKFVILEELSFLFFKREWNKNLLKTLGLNKI